MSLHDQDTSFRVVLGTILTEQEIRLVLKEHLKKVYEYINKHEEGLDLLEEEKGEFKWKEHVLYIGQPSIYGNMMPLPDGNLIFGVVLGKNDMEAGPDGDYCLSECKDFNAAGSALRFLLQNLEWNAKLFVGLTTYG